MNIKVFKLRRYFRHFQNTNHIFNEDEIYFSMRPKTTKVTAPKIWKNVYHL